MALSLSLFLPSLLIYPNSKAGQWLAGRRTAAGGRGASSAMMSPNPCRLTPLFFSLNPNRIFFLRFHHHNEADDTFAVFVLACGCRHATGLGRRERFRGGGGFRGGFGMGEEGVGRGG